MEKWSLRVGRYPPFHNASWSVPVVKQSYLTAGQAMKPSSTGERGTRLLRVEVGVRQRVATPLFASVSWSVHPWLPLSYLTADQATEPAAADGRRTHFY